MKQKISEYFTRLPYFLFTVMLVIVVALEVTICLTGCTEANSKSREISQKANNFETPRKLTIINTRTDTIILEYIGTFSVQQDETSGDIDIISAVGYNRYKKDFFTLNDWTIYYVEDLSNSDVDLYYTELNLYPKSEE